MSIPSITNELWPGLLRAKLPELTINYAPCLIAGELRVMQRFTGTVPEFGLVEHVSTKPYKLDIYETNIEYKMGYLLAQDIAGVVFNLFEQRISKNKLHSKYGAQLLLDSDFLGHTTVDIVDKGRFISYEVALVIHECGDISKTAAGIMGCVTA